MSPVSIMDTTLPSTTSSLFNVPKLAEDGSNWITDGRAIKPTPFLIDEKTKALTKPDGSTPTQARKAASVQHDHGSAPAARPEPPRSVRNLGRDLPDTRG